MPGVLTAAVCRRLQLDSNKSVGLAVCPGDHTVRVFTRSNGNEWSLEATLEQVSFLSGVCRISHLSTIK